MPPPPASTSRTSRCCGAPGVVFATAPLLALLTTLLLAAPVAAEGRGDPRVAHETAHGVEDELAARDLHAAGVDASPLATDLDVTERTGAARDVGRVRIAAVAAETRYVIAGPERLARVVEPNSRALDWPSAPPAGYVLYPLTNHLGSAAVTVNADAESAAIVTAQTQLPYGADDARVETAGYGGWEPDYVFTGKEEDPDVGLVQHAGILRRE